MLVIDIRIVLLFWLQSAGALRPVSGAAFFQVNAGIQNEYVRTGNNATLFCQPALELDNVNRVTWWKEDKKIVEVVGGRRVFWDAGPYVALQPDKRGLYFRRVSYQDSGEYYCEVNGRRSRNSLARLLVQGLGASLSSELSHVQEGN